MSNMSYCRFHNTLMDLQDCRDALDEMGNSSYIMKRVQQFRNSGTEEDLEEASRLRDQIDEYVLSSDEYRAARKLIELCREIADSYDESILVVDDGEEW